MDKKRHQASVWGGIFTIVMATIILGYMAAIFFMIFQRSDYTVVESSTLFDQSGILSTTVWDMAGTLPQ